MQSPTYTDVDNIRCTGNQTTGGVEINVQQGRDGVVLEKTTEVNGPFMKHAHDTQLTLTPSTGEPPYSVATEVTVYVRVSMVPPQPPLP